MADRAAVSGDAVFFVAEELLGKAGRIPLPSGQTSKDKASHEPAKWNMVRLRGGLLAVMSKRTIEESTDQGRKCRVRPRAARACKFRRSIGALIRNAPRRNKRRGPPARPEGLDAGCIRTSFVGFRSTLGSSGFRFRFAAIEPADGVGANRPRSDLRGLGLLALAVRLLVGRADEAAFDEDVRLWGVLGYAKQAT
jgi:hypothetical protein